MKEKIDSRTAKAIVLYTLLFSIMLGISVAVIVSAAPTISKDTSEIGIGVGDGTHAGGPCQNETSVAAIIDGSALNEMEKKSGKLDDPGINRLLLTGSGVTMLIGMSAVPIVNARDRRSRFGSQ